MPPGWPENPDCFPLLATEKHYFRLDAEGYLQYFLYSQAEKRWEIFSADLFQQKIHGFDAVVDTQNSIHLFAYESTGGLFYLASPFSGQSPPLLLYRDEHKKIGHLSACRDQKNNLHLLYLTSSERYKMWWLFYLCYEQQSNQQNKLQKRKTPLVIDFGYGPFEQYGLIGTNYQDQLFILYRLFSANNFNLAFRFLTGNPRRPGETIFLQGEKGECCLPSFFADRDHALHFSWVSRQDKTKFLNYACRTPSGKWENFFNLEISPDSFFLAPLFQYKDKLFLAWKKGRTLFHLYSQPGNENWRWGKNQIFSKEIQLLRLRPADSPTENLPFQGPILFTTFSSPPQKTLQLQDFVPPVLESAEKENGNESALHILDILSSYTLTRAGNLQTTNAYLQQKLEQQEKIFYQRHAVNLTQKKSLEEKLATKQVELEKIEKLLQQTLAELHERLQRQKEEITLLQAQYRSLHLEKEELKKTNILQATNLARLNEEIVRLTQENKTLQAEKFKKSSFLAGLFRKITVKR